MRASRLVAILLLLQARGQMTGKELADELEVSLRTIYRDLSHLAEAGVPVWGEKGEGGGYRLLAGYRTNLTGLTEEEASGLLLAGAPGPATQLGLGSMLAATRLKLLAAVPPALRDVATHAAARFHLDPTGWAHVGRGEEPHVAALADAVMQDRRVRVRYERGDRRVVERVLDPLGLVHKTGSWYLVAGVGGRTRIYRADRIRELERLAAPAVRPDGFDLPAFWTEWEQAWARELPTFRVRVRLGPLARRHRDSFGGLTPQAVDDGPPDVEGWVTTELTFDDRRVAVAALLALAPEVEVLEPADVRRDLVEIAEQAIERQAAAAGRFAAASQGEIRVSCPRVTPRRARRSGRARSTGPVQAGRGPPPTA